jgi:hypothetical protein
MMLEKFSGTARLKNKSISGACIKKPHFEQMQRPSYLFNLKFTTIESLELAAEIFRVLRKLD